MKNTVIIIPTRLNAKRFPLGELSNNSGLIGIFPYGPEVFVSTLKISGF